MKRLENKVALVTGGTSGIGYSTAQEFLAEGARVIITSRSQARLDKAVDSLGTGAHGIVSDASDLNEVSKLPEAIKTISEMLHILFLNASSDVVAPFEMQSAESYDHTFNVNARSAFFTIQKLLPFIRKGGSIILNGTIAVDLAMLGISPLIAAKAATVALARSLAVELAAKGIRVNSISAGVVKTPGAIEKAARFMGVEKLEPDQFDDFAKNLTQGIPMKRLGESAEVAKVALFLASDESSYVTGADLVVDGGKSIAW